MRDFPGAPGTYLFLLLKCLQFLLSGFVFLCMTVMPVADHYYYLLGFRLNITLCWLMGAETGLISFTCFAAYNLAEKAAMRYAAIGVLAATDWVAATLSLAVASVLVSALMDYPDDLICVSESQCRILKLLSVPAFISWSANALSHLITLWFMPGGV